MRFCVSSALTLVLRGSALRFSLLPGRYAPSFLSLRRSPSPGSPIRPGQFGYGRVPFSLPLHRPNRNARHASNATAEEGRERASGGAAAEEEEDEDGPAERRKEEGEEERGNGEEGGGGGVEDVGERPTGGSASVGESADRAADRAEPTPAARPADRAPDGHGPREAPRQDAGGPRQTDRAADRNPGRQTETQANRYRPALIPRPPPTNHERRTDRRVPPPFSSSSSSSVSRYTPRRDPPYGLPQSRPRPPQHAGPPNPDIWPLQHPGAPQDGEGGPLGGPAGGQWGPRMAPQNLKCSGPEKEHRRCSEQVSP